MTLPAGHQVEESELPKRSEPEKTTWWWRQMAEIGLWPNQFQTRIFHRIVKMMTGNVYNDSGAASDCSKKILEETNLYGDLMAFPIPPTIRI
jgi:hypothetical protein